MLAQLESTTMVMDLKIEFYKISIHSNFICTFSETPVQI